VHLEMGLGVLHYQFQQRWKVDELVLEPSMYTYAFYWSDRPCNLYLWYDKGGGYKGAYFNIVDQADLTSAQFAYRDLFVDLLVYPDGRQVFLDRHELPVDFPRELRSYVKEAESLLQKVADDIVNACRMFLSVRGLDAGFKGLELEELRLEAPAPENAEEYAGYFLRNSEFLANYGPVRDQHFCKSEAQRVLAEQELTNPDTLKMWIRIVKENRIIGSIKFTNLLRGSFQSCFVGYALDEEYTNRGYMTAALDSATDYMFSMERFHRIEANIMPGNLASLRLVEKLGFLYEGRAQRYLFINGRWRDHVHMVLLNGAVE